MTIEQLQVWQPRLFQEFHQILRSHKLAHAYLFSGSFASLEMVLMLAQSCFCEKPSNALPCQTCRACRLIASNDFTDVKRIAPTNNILKTDVVRTFLQDFYRSGFESDKQVFIIEGADKLHPNAANSLLKLIEEPQSKLHVFLLTDQETAVLPTIRSRCQIFHFPKNRDLLLKELEKTGLLKSQSQLLVDLSSDLDSAIALANSTHFRELLSACQKWVAQFLAEDPLVYLSTAKLATLANDKTEQAQILSLLTLLLGQELTSAKAQKGLEQLLQAKRMWQVNVNFQNVLEYMIFN